MRKGIGAAAESAKRTAQRACCISISQGDYSQLKSVKMSGTFFALFCFFFPESACCPEEKTGGEAGGGGGVGQGRCVRSS